MALFPSLLKGNRRMVRKNAKKCENGRPKEVRNRQPKKCENEGKLQTHAKKQAKKCENDTLLVA